MSRPAMKFPQRRPGRWTSSQRRSAARFAHDLFHDFGTHADFLQCKADLVAAGVDVRPAFDDDLATPAQNGENNGR